MGGRRRKKRGEKSGGKGRAEEGKEGKDGLPSIDLLLSNVWQPRLGQSQAVSLEFNPGVPHEQQIFECLCHHLCLPECALVGSRDLNSRSPLWDVGIQAAFYTKCPAPVSRHWLSKYLCLLSPENFKNLKIWALGHCFCRVMTLFKDHITCMW